MKNIRLILLFSLLSAGISSAQAYKTAIGARLGWFPGFTIKHFISEQNALEGIVHMRYRGVGVSGLFEHHQETSFLKRMYWMYGGGAHATFIDRYRYYDPYSKYYKSGYGAFVGIDGFFGMEYVFEEVPFAATVDVKPMINFVPYFDFWFDSALSIRYYFGQ